MSAGDRPLTQAQAAAWQKIWDLLLSPIPEEEDFTEVGEASAEDEDN